MMWLQKLDDKLLVSIHNLRAQSWYYVCLEWENINRHNETTGTSCKIYRTLDRFGKTASTAVEDVELAENTDALLRFRLRYAADYPVRLTAYLNQGPTKVPSSSPPPFLLALVTGGMCRWRPRRTCSRSAP